MLRLTVSSMLASGLLLAASSAGADTILVGAPVWNQSSAWLTQLGDPPSGPTFQLADEFSLTSSQFVTTIGVELFGPPGNPSTPFNLSLVTSLDSTTPLYSADFKLPNSSASFDLPVNAVVNAGTYFLRLTTDGFVAWLASDPAFSYVEAFGTVDGLWQRNFAGTWVDQGDQPAVFRVNGKKVPEPQAWLVMALGFALIGARARRAAQR
jgi:hypothetical protein